MSGGAKVRSALLAHLFSQTPCPFKTIGATDIVVDVHSETLCASVTLGSAQLQPSMMIWAQQPSFVRTALCCSPTAGRFWQARSTGHYDTLIFGYSLRAQAPCHLVSPFLILRGHCLSSSVHIWISRYVRWSLASHYRNLVL